MRICKKKTTLSSTTTLLARCCTLGQGPRGSSSEKKGTQGLLTDPFSVQIRAMMGQLVQTMLMIGSTPLDSALCEGLVQATAVVQDP
jgi:hypothetical protein